MFDRKTLKSRAKNILTRSYFIIFIACLAVNIAQNSIVSLTARRVQSFAMPPAAQLPSLRVVAIFTVIILLALISLALSIFLISPLKVGLKRFMLSTAEGDSRLEHLLFAFKNNYFNIVLTQFMKKLFVFLWSLPAFIPIVVGFLKFDLAERISELSALVNTNSVSAALSLFAILTVLLLSTAVLSVPAIIKELQYALTEYILAETPTIAWNTAMQKSKEMMVGNKWALVKLIFSFAGWYVIANLFCCIGNFVLMPYVEATLTEMYLELCGRGYNRDININF